MSVSVVGVDTARSRRPALTRVAGVRPGLVLAWAFVALLVLAALFPALLTPHSPLDVDLRNLLAPPSWAHPLGTDEAGRDLYTRVVYGAGQSLGIGIGATALAITVAIGLGFLGGLAGGAVDAVINRALEVAFAFPVLLLALLLVSVRGPSAAVATVAVGLGSAPGYARIVRGQVLAVRTAPYVDAAVALGHGPWRVLRRHIFPNAMRPLVSLITLGVAQSIVWASAMAFLGLGVPPPSPEWGALLDAGRIFVTTAWWLEVLPGLVIVATALAVTTVGRDLQTRWEGAGR